MLRKNQDNLLEKNQENTGNYNQTSTDYNQDISTTKNNRDASLNLAGKIIANKKNKTSNAIKLADFFRNKFSKFLSLIIYGISSAKSEYGSIKEKSKDLLNTNYNLGLKHLERGNLGDAIFRFKFIIKFWPNHYDSYYQLAYCYFLQKRYPRAKYYLDLLQKNNPQVHDKSQELIDRINEILNDNDQ
jgi:tetratricopeptide (TPR) repeat protein